MGEVGTGPKSADDMTYEEARDAMRAILDAEPARTTLGAFLLANRWKTNTPEELAAFTDEICARAEYAVPDADPVDCGANYDGKTKTALLSVGAGIVAASVGTPVIAHSGDRTPMSMGCAYKHVLDELGVRTDITPEESAELVDETGFGFYYQPRFSPDIADLHDRRNEMGVRTFINTVETLVNPADADVHLGSFYHLSFAKRVCDTLDRSEYHDIDRVVMFQGLEGYDEIRPGYTKVAEWEDGEFDDYEIETAEYGMNFEREDLRVEDVPRDSARITEEVLSGERDDHFADAVALNAALRVYARRDAETLEDALAEARGVLYDGKAEETLDALREVSGR
ncbi:MAG: anthranilate phosphoribosyltransferase [Halobacteriales archaeon]|nr:anthranilate phosphoribosyltransferase [Halobacteriales archaeon]